MLARYHAEYLDYNSVSTNIDTIVRLVTLVYGAGVDF